MMEDLNQYKPKAVSAVFLMLLGGNEDHLVLRPLCHLMLSKYWSEATSGRKKGGLNLVLSSLNSGIY